MTIVQFIHFLRENGLDVIILRAVDKLLTAFSGKLDRLRKAVSEQLQRSIEKKAAPEE